MLSDGPSHTLVHLPRNNAQSPDNQLPRGECRFIFPKTEVDNPQQRCCCVSFTLDQATPGSRCGCGHQAWHHLTEPSGNNVPKEEHLALLDRLTKSDENIKRLQEELAKERRDREEHSKKLIDMVRGNYNNMYFLRYMLEEKLEVQRIHSEDKTEGVLDKAHGALEDIEKLKARIADIDEGMITLEEKVDSTQWVTRSTTPFPDSAAFTPAPLPPISTLPIRVEDKHPEAWNVRVILLPSRKQAHAFTVDSLAYRRCLSRGLMQDLHFQNKSAQQFVQCVDAGFAPILRGRPWLPLRCLKSENMQLAELPIEKIMYLMWDWRFLEEHCIAVEKAHGDVIYVALQDTDLSWSEIRHLPRIFGSDETCWHHDSELDGVGPRSSGKGVDRMEYQLESPPQPRINSIYEPSPPPYSSNSPRLPSALGVLASAAASYSSSSSSLVISPVSTPVPISALLNDDEYDEHRDKRTKRGALRPEPHSTGIATERPKTSSSSVLSSPPRPQMIMSARSKRRIDPAKTKEPMDWRPSEMKFGSMRGFMNRNSKNTSAAEASSSSSTATAGAQQMDQH